MERSHQADRGLVVSLVVVTLASAAGATGQVALARTGQTTRYATGDDGDLEVGVAWPVPRVNDNGD